jgi:8-oxo-dGTP pyrophosphatase MutT (NUDIX family)
MKAWKTLSRETILDHSRYLRVEDHIVELPDGRQIPNWPWIITYDYVNVVAKTDQGKFICFRQTKYGVEGVSLSPVGGHIEAEEDPLAAAKRELLEETGYQARSWKSLGSFRVDANHGCGTAYLFLAEGAVKINEPNSDDLEEQKLLLLDREEMQAALLAGEFKVLGWGMAVAMVLIKT